MLQDFLKPRLVGGRFEEHTLPLDVLKDWAAFEELVVEVAKNLYLRENPDRKRTPRGFADDFSLHLSDVEAGSAIPVLKRWTAGEKLPFADHFDKALAVVQSAIVAVNAGQPVPDDFPRDYPTPEGGIQMEWRQGPWELSAEVDLATLNAELLAVNVVTRASKVDAASLSAREGWSKVTAFVTHPDSQVG